MDRQEAANLAVLVRREPRWHAEAHFNPWNERWSIFAWQGDGEEDGDHGVSLDCPAQWVRLKLKEAS